MRTAASLPEDCGGTDATEPSVAGPTAAEAGDEAGRWRWEYVRSGGPDLPPLAIRVSRALAERIRWRAAASPQPAHTSPTTRRVASANALVTGSSRLRRGRLHWRPDPGADVE